MNRFWLHGICLAAAAAAVIGVFAQNSNTEAAPEPKPTTGVAKLKAAVGSFKLEGTGTVDVQFTGTLLIVRAEGQPMPSVEITGDVRKEFDSEEMGRTAWFGTGRAVIKGSWRHVTVFGENMDATWNGAGIAQVYGEFDASGETGTISVDGSEPFEWMSAGLTFYVPASSDPRIGVDREQDPRMPTPRGVGPQPGPAIN